MSFRIELDIISQEPQRYLKSKYAAQIDADHHNADGVSRELHEAKIDIDSLALDSCVH